MSFRPNFIIPVQILENIKKSHYAPVNGKKSLQIEKVKCPWNQKVCQREIVKFRVTATWFCIGFEVLTAVIMKSMVFCVVKLCSCELRNITA
jgi:hypothetical protein